MLGRKALQENQMAEYKQSVIKARETKKRIQNENGAYWKKQVDWRADRLDEIKKEPYDPELVWNIEGPERKKTDAAIRQAISHDVKAINQVQKVGFFQRKEDEKNLDLNEGQKLVENDLDNKDLEKQLLAFKR